MNSVAVVGAGAWGTALAIQAHRAGNRVTLWTRTPFAGRISPHLPLHPLPDAVRVTDELPGEGFDAVILASPVQHLRGVASRMRPGAPLLVVSKGMERGTLLLPLEILTELHPGAEAAVLTGPNFAHEVAAGLPAASVVAAADAGLRGRMIGLMGSPGFRLYGNADVVGAQIGGAAKNVIAIAAGAVTGAGLGENARAALITRGLAELGRLATALGGRAETMAGLSGLGDLLLTCTGASSRNFRYGQALGQGATPEEALLHSAGVVEGVATAPALMARATGIDLPVCGAVAALVTGRTTLADAIQALLSRPMRDE
jgi:glycerol-3-phosphate dehydrogenase (NAD(P)+)